jgi:hypothetical protein
VARKNLAVRIWYQLKDEPNAYGEHQNLIKGLVMPAVNIEPIKTRLKTYAIVRMKPPVSDGGVLTLTFTGLTLTFRARPRPLGLVSITVPSLKNKQLHHHNHLPK